MEFPSLNKPISEIELHAEKRDVLTLLDFCRGLAIAWVFLLHYKGGWFGWQAVHIFIVLSGFVLTYSCLKKNRSFFWKEWYLKRFERILPAYWLVCLLGFIVIVFTDIIFGKYELLTSLQINTRNLILDIALLRDLFYQSIFNYPNGPLWFIPMIVSFYLFFPWVYERIYNCKTAKHYLIVLSVAAAVEFIYRAISIYWLDGLPIGYDDPSIGFSNLDRLSSWVPFQMAAPFGLFLSRLAEFVLGMAGAIATVQNSQIFNRVLLNFWTGATGVLLWLAGNVLIYVGLWGWIFSDFIIALGLILWVVNLAWIFKQKSAFLFSGLNKLSDWSYYIYLTHYVLFYVSSLIEKKLTTNADSLSSVIASICMLSLVIIGTWVSSWLLKKFDDSKLPRLVIQKSIARFLVS